MGLGIGEGKNALPHPGLLRIVLVVVGSQIVIVISELQLVIIFVNTFFIICRYSYAIHKAFCVPCFYFLLKQ